MKFLIGQSDGQAGRALTEPYRPQHLVAILVEALFDIGKLRLAPNVPREITRLTELGKPIDHLFG